jgi:hypothetical protein
MAVFSIRHRRALQSGALTVELPERLRGRIWRALSSQNASWGEVTETNWHYETDILSELPSALLDVYGDDKLTVQGEPVDLESFVRRADAEFVCDVVELFCAHEQAGPQAAATVNRVFTEEESALRLLDGAIVKLDAGIISTLMEEAHELLSATRFDGARGELRNAEDDLMDGDVQGAIHEAGKSFESVAKGLLDVTDKAAGDLVQLLSAAGYFDALPLEARSAFLKQVMHAVPGMRNKLGGHGQGREELVLPHAYGKLAVHLAAAFNLFLLELAVERGDAQRESETPLEHGSDVPGLGDFAAPPLADDDIPF